MPVPGLSLSVARAQQESSNLGHCSRERASLAVVRTPALFLGAVGQAARAFQTLIAVSKPAADDKG
jgi:hypothetical protein